MILWGTSNINFFGVRVVKMNLFFMRKMMVGSKNIFFMSNPLIFNFKGFLGFFIWVNLKIPNTRIFKHTILELSYELDSKNMCYTFQTFFFSNLKA